MSETIRTKLQSACEARGLTFFYDTWNRVNRSLETEFRDSGGNVYPAALMISTSSGAFAFNMAGTHRQEEVVLALFQRTERDNTMLDSAIQEEMLDIAGKLLADDIPTHGLEIVGESVRYSPFTDRLDENVAGIVLTMTIKDLTPEECR